MDTAYFVRRPRVAGDLLKPHPLDSERPYAVVGTVTLSAADYENFISDMLADRRFLSDAAGLCAEGGTMRCLLIRRSGCAGGVLAVPERGELVGWAAYAAPER